MTRIMALLPFLAVPVLASEPPPSKSPQSAQPTARAVAHRKFAEAFSEDQAAGAKLGWAHFAPTCMQLAKEEPADRFGFDCLLTILLEDPNDDSDFRTALDLMLLHHAKGRRMGDVCPWLVSPQFFGTKAARVEALFREVIEKNPIADVRAEAVFGLSQFLKNRSQLARQIKTRNGADLARCIDAAWGHSFLDVLRTCDTAEAAKEAERLTVQGQAKYSEYWKARPLPGREAPDITGNDLKGSTMSLATYRGKVLVLSFWGFACVPCRAMFPQERSLASRLEHRPFALLGVNTDLDLADVRRRCSEEKVTWRSWWDGGDTGNPISLAWKIRFWPSVFVIDREGLIRYRNIRGKSLEIAVDSLMLEAESS
jgi:peroxiredoxin